MGYLQPGNPLKLTVSFPVMGGNMEFLKCCKILDMLKVCSDCQWGNLQEVFSTSFNLKQEAFIRRDED